MNIAIIALGSRGDVQPFVALAKAIEKQGYDVNIVTHSLFKNFIIEHGLKFSPVIPDDPRSLLDSRAGHLFSSGIPLFSFIGGFFFFKSMRTLLPGMLDDCRIACKNSDLIISSLTTPGQQIAEKMHIPCIIAGLWPGSPTNAYPHPALSFNIGKLNKLSHKLIELLTYIIYIKPIAKWRKKHNMPPMSVTKGIYAYVKEKKYPWIFGFSEYLLKRPKEWADNLHISGYWFLDEIDNWTPDPELVEFINAGPKPIYVGFGSMIYQNKTKLLKILSKTLKATGQRAVLFAGWSNLEAKNLPDNIYNVDSVPHSWLFPKMAVAIHHGGSGTTSSALRAGIPSIIIPFLADQYFWAKELEKQGLSPKAIPKHKLSAKKLTNRLSIALYDQQIRNNVRELGKKLRTEQGAQNAADIIIDNKV